jgi:hypothetical protein
MMLVLAAILASAAVAPSGSPAPPAPIVHKRKRHAPVKKLSAAAAARQEEIVLLALRRELLHDFLVEARTERPAFEDERMTKTSSGLSIGPTSADVDFLGSPIVRARVTNGSGHVADAIVTAMINGLAGKHAEASAVVERIQPGEARWVELFCPATLSPTSISWKVSTL